MVRTKTLEATGNFALDFDITFKAVGGMYSFLIHASLRSLLNFAVLFLFVFVAVSVGAMQPPPRCPC